MKLKSGLSIFMPSGQEMDQAYYTASRPTHSKKDMVRAA